MNLRRWFHEHSLKLLAIRDTPEAIAGGVAIGIFLGSLPCSESRHSITGVNPPGLINIKGD